MSWNVFTGFLRYCFDFLALCLKLSTVPSKYPATHTEWIKPHIKPNHQLRTQLGAHPAPDQVHGQEPCRVNVPSQAASNAPRQAFNHLHFHRFELQNFDSGAYLKVFPDTFSNFINCRASC